MIESSPYKATTASEKKLPANNGICVRIEQASNGVIVEAYSKEHSMKEKQYVFSTLEEALGEIPSIMSVAKAEAADAKEEPSMLESD